MKNALGEGQLTVARLASIIVHQNVLLVTSARHIRVPVIEVGVRHLLPSLLSWLRRRSRSWPFTIVVIVMVGFQIARGNCGLTFGT